jgi:hypothetical protein
MNNKLTCLISGIEYCSQGKASAKKDAIASKKAGGGGGVAGGRQKVRELNVIVSHL